MQVKKHIPNSITTLNLLTGCIGVSLAFSGQLEWAAWCIGIASVFDFFDGFAARLLNVKSAIGKDLDSLADVISFGLLPGALVYMLMKQSSNLPEFRYLTSSIAAGMGFIIPIFSAIRLAKFNNDPRQSDSFIGMPTPASAIFFGSLPFILSHETGGALELLISNLIVNYYILLALAAGISFLMVSELPLFSLKIKNLNWNENKPRFLLILLSVPMLAIQQFVAIPLIIILYIILSLVFRNQGVKNT